MGAAPTGVEGEASAAGCLDFSGVGGGSLDVFFRSISGGAPSAAHAGDRSLMLISSTTQLHTPTVDRTSTMPGHTTTGLRTYTCNEDTKGSGLTSSLKPVLKRRCASIEFQVMRSRQLFGSRVSKEGGFRGSNAVLHHCYTHTLVGVGVLPLWGQDTFIVRSKDTGNTRILHSMLLSTGDVLAER